MEVAVGNGLTAEPWTRPAGSRRPRAPRRRVRRLVAGRGRPPLPGLDDVCRGAGARGRARRSPRAGSPSLASRDVRPGAAPDGRQARAHRRHGHDREAGRLRRARQHDHARSAVAGRPARGGDTYRLTGHKWFCSAPMSDAFLVLAQTEAGVDCFLVPRVLDDGTRNAIRAAAPQGQARQPLQRLLRGRARRHLGRPRRRRGPRHPHHHRHGRLDPARLRARLDGHDARGRDPGRAPRPPPVARSAPCSSTSR